MLSASVCLSCLTAPNHPRWHAGSEESSSGSESESESEAEAGPAKAPAVPAAKGKAAKSPPATAAAQKSAAKGGGAAPAAKATTPAAKKPAAAPKSPTKVRVCSGGAKLAASAVLLRGERRTHSSASFGLHSTPRQCAATSGLPGIPQALGCDERPLPRQRPGAARTAQPFAALTQARRVRWGRLDDAQPAAAKAMMPAVGTKRKAAPTTTTTNGDTATPVAPTKRPVSCKRITSHSEMCEVGWEAAAVNA